MHVDDAITIRCRFCGSLVTIAADATGFQCPTPAPGCGRRWFEFPACVRCGRVRQEDVGEPGWTCDACNEVLARVRGGAPRRRSAGAPHAACPRCGGSDLALQRSRALKIAAATVFLPAVLLVPKNQAKCRSCGLVFRATP